MVGRQVWCIYVTILCMCSEWKRRSLVVYGDYDVGCVCESGLDMFNGREGWLVEFELCMCIRDMICDAQMCCEPRFVI